MTADQILPQALFVGFTGHRAFPNADKAGRWIGEALSDLASRTQAPLAAVSSVASGSDTLFAETVAENGLPWLLMLPFPVEEFKQDFEGQEEDWARVEALLPKALCQWVEPPTESRDDAYLDCGYRTVDECDVLIALWDGGPARGLGGTAQVVEYARAREKPLVWIHADTGEVVRERFASVASTSHPQAEAPEAPNGFDLAQAALEKHDQQAEALRPRAHNLNLLLIIAHQLATATVVAALVWKDGFPASLADVTKILILSAALALPLMLHSVHHGWMEHRMRAEICRSALALWALGRPHETFALLRFPGFESLQRALLLLRLQHPPVSSSTKVARESYLRNRIDNQAEYFTRKAKQTTVRLRWLRRVSVGFTLGAIFAGLVLLAHPPASDTAAYPWLKFLSVTLPLVTAALVGSILSLDYGRRAARFHELARQLEHIRPRIEFARTETGLIRAASEVERMLLLEIWEWFSLARFAASNH